MRKSLTPVVLLLGLYTTSSQATEYIYRDIMANTLPSARCESQSESVISASKPYHMERFTKRFCQSQGYGWHVEAVKNNGKPVCTPCNGADADKVRCHIEDVIVSCKLIKPGSVGMLPGKG